MTQDSSLIEFMENPGSYGHNPDEVQHIQTHISHVFMTGPLVYKIKKPVNFEFLDFSTLEKRKYYCEREVALNSRLCDDIYLGVVPITKKGNGFYLESPGKGETVEYAVKMKRLPEENFLHNYIDSGELGSDMLDRIADKLSDFYKNQQPDKEIRKWGNIENIRYNTDENFRQTKDFIGQTISKESYHAIKDYTDRYYNRFDFLFQRRVEDQCIVDGHGDLHLEHIHITPEKVRIYDCIEFNDRFRYGDTAADLAFLAMDLDFNGCWKEERYFLEQMAGRLHDRDLLLHINFYKTYRAYVKGKVKSLQSAEAEVGEKEQTKAGEKAREYFDLALRYATIGSTPSVLVVMGRIATGKSTLAEALSDRLNIERFSSDRIRKGLMGVPLNKRTEDSKKEEMYSVEMSQRTYDKLIKNAEEHIRNRKSVILDATYSRREERKRLMKKLGDYEAAIYFIEAQADDQTITERLKSRSEKKSVISDARLEDFEMLNQNYQSPADSEFGSATLFRINTGQKLLGTLSDLYEKLIDQNLERLQKML